MYLHLGCSGFVAYVLDNREEGKKTDGDVLIIQEYSDVFPEDLPGLPPEKQVEFQIDLVSNATLIAKAPYR